MKCGICNQNGELIRDLKEMQPEDFAYTFGSAGR